MKLNSSQASENALLLVVTSSFAGEVEGTIKKPLLFCLLILFIGIQSFNRLSGDKMFEIISRIFNTVLRSNYGFLSRSS